jgi:hypothetical protein
MNKTLSRSAFRAVSDITVHKDQEEGYADDTYPVPEGGTVWADPEFCNGETRSLNGERVSVVLFTIGSTGARFWVPRSEFFGAFEIFDVKRQTGIPSQL